MQNEACLSQELKYLSKIDENTGAFKHYPGFGVISTIETNSLLCTHLIHVKKILIDKCPLLQSHFTLVPDYNFHTTIFSLFSANRLQLNELQEFDKLEARTIVAVQPILLKYAKKRLRFKFTQFIMDLHGGIFVIGL